MASCSRLCRCAVGVALGVAVLVPASRAEASERTYHAFQYNILGGINGGSQFNASVQLLEYKLRQHASDPPVVVTAQEVCERQAFHIMTVALSVVNDYHYSFWPEKIEGTEGCNGVEGNLLLTRGTPYGESDPYFYTAQSSTDYGAHRVRNAVCRVTIVRVGAIGACSTHMSSNRSIASLQINEYEYALASRYGSLWRWPGGDYNLNYYTELPQSWLNYYVDAFYNDPSLTFPVGNLLEKIDYTGVDRNHFAAPAGAVDCSSGYSDHCFLVGRMTLYY